MEQVIRRREQEVWQACDDLWALYGDMKNITGDEIRERLFELGKSKGSPNEIYKYRKTWLLRRGLLPSQNPGYEHDDPIARAARLVHEQLKNEAEREIASLKKQQADELAEKDQQIVKAKNAVDNVMMEFSAIEQKLKEAMHEIGSLKEKLSAEIDLRQAMEREASLKKTLLEQEKREREAQIIELKTIFHNEVIRHTAREKEQADLSAHRIKELMTQIKEAGHDYSERLMALKTESLNQEILAKRFEQEVGEAQGTINGLRKEIASLKQRYDGLHKEHAELMTKMAIKTEELKMAQTLQENTVKKMHDVNQLLKRSELTVARLRATLSSTSGSLHART